MFPFILLVFFFGCEVEPIQPNTNGGNGGGTVTNPVSTYYNIKMRTDFSEDYDSWDFDLGDTTVEVRTAFSEDWDNWDFSYDGNYGDIRTSFSEDYDNWKLQSDDFDIRIRTSFSEDWDNWDIDDLSSGWHADVRTGFSEDWDNWDIYLEEGNIDVRTSFSEDWDNWDGYGNFPSNYPIEYRIATLFVPVITNVLIQKGLIDP